MAADQYEAGQAIDVLVCTKRGKEGEWLPASVYAVSSDYVDVLFEGGARQKFFFPFDDRLKLRGTEPTVVFKV